VWLGKRNRSGTGPAEKGRKRAKTNMEICLSAHPLLQRYAQARPQISKKHAKQIGVLDLKQAARTAGFTLAESEQSLPVLDQQQQSDSQMEDQQIAEATELASFDFVSRKQRRREFLLDYLQ